MRDVLAAADGKADEVGGERVNATCDVLAPRSLPMSGIEGTYMSVATGPNAVKSPRNAVKAMVSERSMVD